MKAAVEAIRQGTTGIHWIALGALSPDQSHWAVSLSSLINSGRELWPVLPKGMVVVPMTGTTPFTGGTSGKPKAVVHSEKAPKSLTLVLTLTLTLMAGPEREAGADEDAPDAGSRPIPTLTLTLTLTLDALSRPDPPRLRPHVSHGTPRIRLLRLTRGWNPGHPTQLGRTSRPESHRHAPYQHGLPPPHLGEASHRPPRRGHSRLPSPTL